MRGKAGGLAPALLLRNDEDALGRRRPRSQRRRLPRRAGRSLVFPALHRTQALLYLGVHLLRLVRDAFRD